MDIIKTLVKDTKTLCLRYKDNLGYLKWIYNNSICDKDTMCIPYKPYKYDKIHHYYKNKKMIVFINTEKINGKVYNRYYVNNNKINDYLNKFKKRIKLYNKLIMYLKTNKKIKSRTKLYFLYNYHVKKLRRQNEKSN